MCNEMTVAKTILEQLGGVQFLVITGSNHPLSDGNTLHLQLVKNKSGANRLSITLDGDDTYTMRFHYFKQSSFKVDKENGSVTESSDKQKEVSCFDGVYCDMLQDIFEEVTGLHTTLFPRR